MPFGLHSAPATFQLLLDDILDPEMEPNVFVYLDDIIVISTTFEQYLRLLTEVFYRLRDARFRLNPDKCRFCVDQLKYLGHVIDREGIRTDPEKVSAVADWPEPRTVKQVRQFLGLASWYRRFIANVSTIAGPLTQLTKKNARWKWGADEERAFRELKCTLVSARVLACPVFTRRFILQIDASTSGLGAVLTQNFEEGERVIAYASRMLNGAERNNSATELECLAVVWGIRRIPERVLLHRHHRPSVITVVTAARGTHREVSPVALRVAAVRRRSQVPAGSVETRSRRTLAPTNILRRDAAPLQMVPTTPRGGQPRPRTTPRLPRSRRTPPPAHPSQSGLQGAPHRIAVEGVRSPRTTDHHYLPLP